MKGVKGTETLPFERERDSLRVGSERWNVESERLVGWLVGQEVGVRSACGNRSLLSLVAPAQSSRNWARASKSLSPCSKYMAQTKVWEAV